MRARIVVFLLGLYLGIMAQPPKQMFWALNKCPLVLSNIATKPSAAYSLRKLSCTYTGQAVQVRRDGDNAIQDIGFTMTGNLDQTALLNFVNGVTSSSVSYMNTSYSSSFTISIPNAISISSITGISGTMSSGYPFSQGVYGVNDYIIGYYVGWPTDRTYMVRVILSINPDNSIAVTQINARRISGDKTTSPSNLVSAYNSVSNRSFSSTYSINSIDLTLSGLFKGSGYVTTWYDQSGNGKNLIQITDANQPQIVNNGTVNTENGKPTIRFMDTSDKMVALAMDIQTFSAVRKALIGGDPAYMQYFVSVPIDQDFSIRSSSATNWYYGDDNANDFSYGGALYVNNALTKTYPSSLHCLCSNSSAVNSSSTFSLSTAFTYDSKIRALYGGDPVSELIVFPSILSVGERTTLYADQKKYYGTN